MNSFVRDGGDGIIEETEVKSLVACVAGAAGQSTLRPEMDINGFERRLINNVIDLHQRSAINILDFSIVGQMIP